MFWGGFRKFKIFPISKFSQIRYEGLVVKFQIFPKLKKVQNFLGEGGLKKNVDFFHFLWHVFFNALLRQKLMILEWEWSEKWGQTQNFDDLKSDSKRWLLWPIFYTCDTNLNKKS